MIEVNSSIVKWINKMFAHSFNKEWYETYWAFDVHGVILRPNNRKNSTYAEFYPFAKETLKMISDRPDIVMILSTSSYPSEIEYYYQIFVENGIQFKYINENPDIDSLKGNFGFYEKKFYFNAMFEDKAGFDPDTDWEEVYNLLKYYESINYFPSKAWSTKY